MTFNMTVYFDRVRETLFGGVLTQRQVDGQNYIILVWETLPQRFPKLKLDLRWLANMLATTYHETAQAMWPVEEIGYGAGMSYGVPDLETGQTYYGRGFVQLTWRDNYQRATDEIGLTGAEDLVWHAAQALDPVIAAKTMYLGMYQGWFRADAGGPQTLPRYFNETVDDAYGAREIINGDKSMIPSWSYGESIGSLIAGYHDKFLAALNEALAGPKRPERSAPETPTVEIAVTGDVRLIVNGKVWA